MIFYNVVNFSVTVLTFVLKVENLEMCRDVHKRQFAGNCIVNKGLELKEEF